MADVLSQAATKFAKNVDAITMELESLNSEAWAARIATAQRRSQPGASLEYEDDLTSVKPSEYVRGASGTVEYGLFLKKGNFIRAGDVLYQYLGDVLSLDDARRATKEHGDTYIIRIYKGKRVISAIDAFDWRTSSAMRYANFAHSAWRNNCFLYGRLHAENTAWMVAAIDMWMPGEELLMLYQASTSDLQRQMECYANDVADVHNRLTMVEAAIAGDAFAKEGVEKRKKETIERMIGGEHGKDLGTEDIAKQQAVEARLTDINNWQKQLCGPDGRISKLEMRFAVDADAMASKAVMTAVKELEGRMLQECQNALKMAIPPFVDDVVTKKMFEAETRCRQALQTAVPPMMNDLVAKAVGEAEARLQVKWQQALHLITKSNRYGAEANRYRRDRPCESPRPRWKRDSPERHDRTSRDPRQRSPSPKQL